MGAYVFHRVLHMFQGGTIGILLGSLTNNGMLPASVFDHIDAFGPHCFHSVPLPGLRYPVFDEAV